MSHFRVKDIRTIGIRTVGTVKLSLAKLEGIHYNFFFRKVICCGSMKRTDQYREID